MTVNRMLQEIRGLREDIPLLVPNLDFSEVLNTQQEILQSLDESIRAVVGSKRHGDICILLAGSLSRLEFIPNISDLDFLAVEVRSDTWRNIPAPFGKQIIDRVNAACGRYDKLKGTLSDRIRTRNSHPCLRDIKLELWARPMLSARALFARDDIFERLGQDLEPAWSPSARAILVFEAIGWTGARGYLQQLRKQANAIYAAESDLVQQQFPLTTLAFVEFVAKSMMLAKLASVNKIERTPDKAHEIEARLAKAMWTSHWYPTVKKLGLHALFWCAVFGFKPINIRTDVVKVLRAPPLSTVVAQLPALLTNAREGWPKFVDRLDVEVPRRITLAWSQVESAVDPRSKPSLPKLFLEMMHLFTTVRKDGWTDEDRAKVKKANLELAKVSGHFTRITDWILKQKSSEKDQLFGGFFFN